jgi:hypothetical protein
MQTLNENSRRIFIGNFYKQNIDKGKAYTVNFFKRQKVATRTVYDIITRVENNEQLERKPGSGRKPKKSKQEVEKYVEKNVNTISKSYVKLGKELNVSDKTAKSYLVKYGIKKFKRKTAPKSNENQSLKQRKCLNKLRRGALKPSLTTHIIEDDESYFTIDGSNNSSSDSYFSHPSLEVPNEIKYKFKEKYPNKVLVWIAVSSAGHSEPFISSTKRFAINSDTYINQCIKKD